MIRLCGALAIVSGMSFALVASASVGSKTLVTVVNGDQVSEFELNGRKLKFSNSNLRREVDLTEQDLKQVKTHLVSIASVASHEKRLCGRAYLEAETQKGRKTFCLKSKTESGKASNELARLLALLIKIR